jgi:hypothetical protein
MEMKRTSNIKLATSNDSFLEDVDKTNSSTISGAGTNANVPKTSPLGDGGKTGNFPNHP